MATRQSPEVTRALRMIAKGAVPHAAARKVGIAISTIYRAQKRQREAAAGKVAEAIDPTIQQAAANLLARTMGATGPADER